MQAKLNPYNLAKIAFPGFQKILDFTATGSESTCSVTVDGDTDKDYFIYIRGLSNSAYPVMLLNDAVTGYGHQELYNSAGSIAAGRYTSDTYMGNTLIGVSTYRLSTPAGFIKTAFQENMRYSSGTTVSLSFLAGLVYNTTANITKISFPSNSGNYTAGTRILVFARRA